MEQEPEPKESSQGLGLTLPSPLPGPSSVSPMLLSPNTSFAAGHHTPAPTPGTTTGPLASIVGAFSRSDASQPSSQNILRPINVTPSNIAPSDTAAGAIAIESTGFAPTPDYTPTMLLDRAKDLATPLSSSFKAKSITEVYTLSTDDLRDSLLHAQSHILDLEKDFVQVRTASSHSALQHAMLAVGFENERDRFEVEKAMARKEVEVLKRNQEGGAGGAYQQAKVAEMQRDMEILRNRLKRAKKLIITERETVKALTKDNDRLKKRIRENRAHNNMAERALITAEAEAGRRRQMHHGGHSRNPSNIPEDGLAALGEVASQALAEQRDEEARGTAVNSPMHTPARLHTPSRSQVERGAAGGPSPAAGRFAASSAAVQTPPSAAPPHLMSPVALSPSRYTTWAGGKTPKSKKRARDDTISASEGEGRHHGATPRSSKAAARTSGQTSLGTPQAKKQRTAAATSAPKTPRSRAKSGKQSAPGSSSKGTAAAADPAKRAKHATAPSTPVPEPREGLQQYSPQSEIVDRRTLEERRRGAFM